MAEFKYTTKDIEKRFDGLSKPRQHQMRNGTQGSKQILVEGEDWVYERTEIKYSESAKRKIDAYYKEQVEKKTRW